MRRRLGWMLVLAITVAVWAPTLTYDWVETWDDAVFILGNPHVQTWDWTWMATTQWYGHWMPLTWVSFVANYHLFGFKATSWHAVNMVLHVGSALIVYAIARRLVGSIGGAVFAALLFAVHPLRMESVAWLTERKDVLMGFFFLASVLLWMQRRRWWAFAAFVAACASKSPAVMLPAWLLALEWYEYRRVGLRLPLRGVLRRLSPFIGVSVVVTVMAFWALKNALVSVPWSTVGIGPRALQMAYSAVYYVQQTLWPSRLSGLIEYTWVPSWSQWEYPVAVALVLLTACVLWFTRYRVPALIASAFAYTVAILPQSGLFQNGPQLVANRYSYLACLPVALLAGAALTAGARRWPRAAFALAGVGVVALVVSTEVALPMWRTGDAFWIYAAEHEPACTQCQDMAAAADLRQGNFRSAIARQQQAVRVSDTTMFPRYERHWNLAAVSLLAGDHEVAIREMRVYLAMVPADVQDRPDHRAHMDRARVALRSLGVEP